LKPAKGFFQQSNFERRKREKKVAMLGGGKNKNDQKFKQNLLFSNSQERLEDL